MRLPLQPLLLVLCAAFVAAQDELDDEEQVFKVGSQRKSLAFSLEHSFDGGKHYSPRGQLYVAVGAGEKEAASVDPVTIQGGDLASLRELVAQKGLYQLRAKSDPANPASPYVTIAVPVCAMQKSGFREDIMAHLSADGKLMAMHYQSPIVAMERPCDPAKLPAAVNIQGKARVVADSEAHNIPVQAQGRAPPGVAAVADPDAPAEKKAPEQQSFLRKYWYIILPVAFMVLFGGGPPPEQQGQQGEGQQGQGEAQAGAGGVQPAGSTGGSSSGSGAGTRGGATKRK